MKRGHSSGDLVVSAETEELLTDDRDGPNMITTNQLSQPKSRKSRKVSSKLTAEQNDSIEAAVDTVLSQVSLTQSFSELPSPVSCSMLNHTTTIHNLQTQAAADNNGELSLHAVVAKLTLQLNEQQQTMQMLGKRVTELTNQLDMIRQFFGFDNITGGTMVETSRQGSVVASGSNQNLNHELDSGQGQETTSGSSGSSMEMGSAPTPVLPVDQLPTSKPLYSDITKKQIIEHQNNFKRSIITAVYIDQKKRNSRASSLVVTGLKPSESKDDKELFRELCTREFGITANITSVKRLGSWRADGKPQPLLVYLSEISQVTQLINSARLLRQSMDSNTKQHVYINANMTKAEEAAAYQLRLQRRSNPRHKILYGSSQSKNQTEQHPQHEPQLLQRQQDQLLPTHAAPEAGCSTAAASSLNVDANAFLPGAM